MLALLTAVMVAASPSSRVAAPTWSVVNLSEKEATFFVDYLAGELGKHGVAVTTSSQMAALIGLERQQQLLGCSKDSTSCAAELAGALGVGSILIGSLAKFESGYVLNLKLVAANDGRQLASYSERLGSNDALLDYLAKTARELAGLVGSEEAAGSTRKIWWAIPGAVGVGALVAGIVLEALAHGTASDIASGNTMYVGQLDGAISAAGINEKLGWGFIGLAAACVVAAVVLFIVGTP
jgi:hypothetical protein